MGDASALSLAALALRAQLAQATGLEETQVVIGHPQLAVKKQEGFEDKDFLGLFIYRVEPAGYPADGTADGPLYLRAHCLVTALGGTASDGGATSGEKELGLIGAVLARLHSHPVLTILTGPPGNRVPAAQLQLVPAPLTLDD